MAALSALPAVPRLPPWRWWLTTALLLLAAVALWWLFQHHAPGTSRWLPPCLFHALTDLYCPGCGITRALHALAHGQLAVAWRMNPLAMLALPIAAILWLDEGLGRWPAWQRVLSPMRDARLWATLVIVFIVGRNLPWPPFAGWAPG